MDMVNQTVRFYEWAEQTADPRVLSWPLLSSPFPTISVVAFYYFIVLLVGPKFMEKREAFDFGLLLPTYNFALVALNYYIVKEAVVGSYNAGYSYVCTPLNSDPHNLDEMMVANSVWWYYFSKIIELFDTIFFILRKRKRQVSFLHVYHHSTMPLIWWIGAKWLPGGQAMVPVLLNSSVHVIMYTYYGLAALGPNMQKYLWWKKYITIMQLVQFCIAIFHSSMSLYINCPSPAWMHWTLIAYAFSFVILFGNFYIQSYAKRKPISAYTKSSEMNGCGEPNGNVKVTTKRITRSQSKSQKQE